MTLFMSILAFLICLLIIPAFAFATGFALMIPFIGLGLIGQLWTKDRNENVDSTPERRLESLDDWRKRQLSTEEEVWRHAG